MSSDISIIFYQWLFFDATVKEHQQTSQRMFILQVVQLKNCQANSDILGSNVNIPFILVGEYSPIDTLHCMSIRQPCTTLHYLPANRQNRCAGQCSLGVVFHLSCLLPKLAHSIPFYLAPDSLFHLSFPASPCTLSFKDVVQILLTNDFCWSLNSLGCPLGPQTINWSFVNALSYLFSKYAFNLFSMFLSCSVGIGTYQL